MYTEKIKKLNLDNFDYKIGVFWLLLVFFGMTILLPTILPFWATCAFTSYFCIVVAFLLVIYKKINLIYWDFTYKNQSRKSFGLGLSSIIFGILAVPLVVGVFFIIWGSWLIKLNKTNKDGLLPFWQGVERKPITLYLVAYPMFILFFGGANIIVSWALWNYWIIGHLFAEFILYFFLLIFLANAEGAWGMFETGFYKKDFSIIGTNWRNKYTILWHLGIMMAIGILFIIPGILLIVAYLKSYKIEVEYHPMDRSDFK